ncbi:MULTISPECIES: hypothetical protein [unclassified Mesorhizobium]|uniref:hypothetical protein n=1 Tax=unclassified Mesorhizobium TaxID=325217 RepID=UPI000BAFF174|nr:MULTISPECIES: hypothetical protein [unclassified Mesorhizobium]TGT60989.1 hypothetical protein EN813_018635 [Mesorhizobium sp. M00.F.Ca.ET.170.01.1.1]AZO08756.1 hypothetical protein EJ074_06255 [Mesorhizobium sp. M3A.F.Ca.ET.080.04.2.1]PBB84146.1 hypothetical protein CK216_25300 [Mesorhizobium sp. WSM3876]RWB72119.1 MAG: hypothetical protein EOQ49_12800 [Mesorhizobium sp.]RWB83676.1 MAG: hypothetical protein EOQ52_26080 [Mesorhizobium sp.]
MTKLSRIPPLSKTGKKHGGDPTDDQGRFYLCPICGQQVDKRDLRQVIWHEKQGHEPLELDM